VEEQLSGVKMSYKCRFCPAVYSEESELHKHEDTCHADGFRYHIGGMFRCCFRALEVNESRLRSLERGEKKLKCDICGTWLIFNGTEWRVQLEEE